MNISEKYVEALKSFNEFVTVYEWAQRVGKLYPDLLAKAEKEALAQKNDTTGLREIAARISSSLSARQFKNVEVDESERPRRAKYITAQEQKSNQEQELRDDIEPITRIQIINQAKDKLQIFEIYRLDEFKNIQKAFKDFFSLDFELDHANALLDKGNQGEHHPDNLQLLLKYHNGKKNNTSWRRFAFDEQSSYIKDAIKLQSNIADNLSIEIDDLILSQLLERLKAVY